MLSPKNRKCTVLFLHPKLTTRMGDSIRMFPIAASTERVALEDDIIPLKQPIFSNDGRTLLNSIRIQKGQVHRDHLHRNSLG